MSRCLGAGTSQDQNMTGDHIRNNKYICCVSFINNNTLSTVTVFGDEIFRIDRK